MIRHLKYPVVEQLYEYLKRRRYSFSVFLKQGVKHRVLLSYHKKEEDKSIRIKSLDTSLDQRKHVVRVEHQPGINLKLYFKIIYKKAKNILKK